MKALIMLFLLILIGVCVGYLIYQDPGYVLVSYHHTTIETSLWIGLLILIAAYIVINILLWLIRQISSIGWRIGDWSTRRRERKIRFLTNKGLYKLAEGDWQRAETNLINATKHNHTPLANYLGAAYAANTQFAFDRRDEYLHLADQVCDDSRLSVLLTQASLQIQSEQWEQALATLKVAREHTPSHANTLSLLKQVYMAIDDWSQLNELMPQLRKLRIDSDEALDRLQCQVYEHLLCEGSCWDDMPRKWQHNTQLLRLQTSNLIEREQYDEACHLIEHGLKREWDGVLIFNYGLSKSSDANKQLAHAEKWLHKHPHDFSLLLCLGRLSLRSQFYGKAKEYLESALRIQQSTEA
ncbi:MAG: heme biosynthesis protein HemY [Gammaproteobacteria bacterium]|nr:heme biosynthesis protein HemY [Gammaproteobacteria bacterium]